MLHRFGWLIGLTSRVKLKQTHVFASMNMNGLSRAAPPWGLGHCGAGGLRCLCFGLARLTLACVAAAAARRTIE
jgi:hypothetical protein